MLMAGVPLGLVMLIMVFLAAMAVQRKLGKGWPARSPPRDAFNSRWGRNTQRRETPICRGKKVYFPDIIPLLFRIRFY